MTMRIALAGNPNSGKTTLFNVLTGSDQFVGNWPGVTVEKKEGHLKRHTNVIITDLPGVYSLSPYSPEEIVTRNFLFDERPDAIINIIDGSNLERNLYLTTQLTELGIPVVVAVNMMDVVEKRGDRIDVKALSDMLGCRVLAISALKQTGVWDLAEAAIAVAKDDRTVPYHRFSESVEHAIAHIKEAVLHDLPEERQRACAIGIFERDEDMLRRLLISSEARAHIEDDIRACEKELDDDAVSIIANERYLYIASVVDFCCTKKRAGIITVSDRIDRVVTHRIFGLPVFAAIMFIVYLVSMVIVGTPATDFVNDKLFGEGFHLFGGTAYEAACAEFDEAMRICDGYDAYVVAYGRLPEDDYTYDVIDDETFSVTEATASPADHKAACAVLDRYGGKRPEPADYAGYIPGIPITVERGLDALNTSEPIKGLVLDGIVAGVGAVLGFVPQMLVLFVMLAFLEACGYMARIAFVLDRVFRKFGLSGKSFIPMLVGVGCGVPGIMASRTIENERERRMTVITTTFIPCSAKIPFIAMISGSVFGGSAWVSTSAYFVGLAAIIVSGLMLKKTRMFSGDPAPFVMELPAYHMPTLKNILMSTWERGWSFIKKAGTIILLSTILIWFASRFGYANGAFRMLAEDELDRSLLGTIGRSIAPIFVPLGFGTWQAAVASITGLIAKENIVSTMGVLYGAGGSTVYRAIAAVFTPVTGFSFMIFNLLCAPCFAAIGAIKREMNSAKWTWFAIAYQCGFAYSIALIVNAFGSILTGRQVSGIVFVAAVFVAIGMLVLIIRPAKTSERA